MSRPAAPVFVDIPIRGTIDELWQKSQDPVQHVRWDVRFSSIRYLPRASTTEPQQFQYETRLGFGLSIQGYGETIDSSAEGTSALKFGSADPKSLITEGTGCWVYKPQEEQVLFRTIYQYHVRFGAPGRWLDRWVFRPLMGWATAWSFDRLRLWVEAGILPEHSARMALLHALSRIMLSLIWIYHGIVPKWLFPQAGEQAMLEQIGLVPGYELPILRLLGLAEVIIGVALLWRGRSRWLLALVAVAPVLLAVTVVIAIPGALAAPMNALTFNLALLGLAIAAWISEPYAPSAARCQRTREGRA